MEFAISNKVAKEGGLLWRDSHQSQQEEPVFSQYSKLEGLKMGCSLGTTTPSKILNSAEGLS